MLFRSYINENIIGLIKYLGKDSGLITDQKDREMIEINKQEKDNTFDTAYKKANLLQLSRMDFEGKKSNLDIEIKNINTIEEIGNKVKKEGLRVLGVPTSYQTFMLAVGHGIQITTLAEHPTLDLTIDGADQIDEELNMLRIERMKIEGKI